jgi:hypothetical protein
MGERKSCGFAIYTESEHMISENARSFVEEHGPSEYKQFLKADGTITKAGWDKLNSDTQKIELNALAWLRKTFLNARDEGHGGYEGTELIGTLFYDPDDKNQMELLELASPSPGRSERIDFQDTGYGNFRTAMNGVSSFGQTMLGGAIVFFDVDEEF